MRNTFRFTFAVLCVHGWIVLTGCASVAKKEQERNRAWVNRLAIASLHYRRPDGAAADPKAGPGGVDYESQPLPNLRLDCEPAEKLFSQLKLPEIRACLNAAESAAQDFILTFSVQKSNRPLLALRNEEVPKDRKKRPACTDQLLAEIPVPREIFFQGIRDTESPELGCYASGLAPEQAPLLGFRINREITEVAVRISSIRHLKTDEEVRNLMLSWVLRPYWDQQRQQIPARVVPDRLCRVCIGEKNLVRVNIPPVPLWPTEADEAEATQSVKGSGNDVPLGIPHLPEQTGIN